MNDKQIEQWNVNPPLLYLWSRQDWTAKHRAIAQRCGHISRQQRETNSEDNYKEVPVLDHPARDQADSGHANMVMDEHSVENHECEHEKRIATVPADHVDSARCSVDREDHEKKILNENSRQRHGKGKHEKGNEIIPEDKQNGGMAPVREMQKGTHKSSSPDARSKSDIHRPEVGRTSSAAVVGEEVHSQFEPDLPDLSLQRTRYGGSHANIPEDMSRRYRLDGEEPYSGTAHRRSMGFSPGLDYGIRSSEEPFISYSRGNMDKLGGYRRGILERDEYGRNTDGNTDIRSQIQQYGQQDPILSQQRSNYLAGQDPWFGQMGRPLSRRGHPAEPSYNRMNASAMQRYGPQLDELNHTRMGPYGYDRPILDHRNGPYDPLAPRPQPGFQQANSMGFASGLHRPYSNQNSSGWLNE